MIRVRISKADMAQGHAFVIQKLRDAGVPVCRFDKRITLVGAGTLQWFEYPSTKTIEVYYHPADSEDSDDANTEESNT